MQVVCKRSKEWLKLKCDSETDQENHTCQLRSFSIVIHHFSDKHIRHNTQLLDEAEYFYHNYQELFRARGRCSLPFEANLNGQLVGCCKSSVLIG